MNRAKKQLTVSFKTNPTLIHTPQIPTSNNNNDKKKNDSSTDADEKRDVGYHELSSNKESNSNNNNGILSSADVEHTSLQDIHIDPETMTPAELKRARKLQRRVERRRQQELTGIAS